MVATKLQGFAFLKKYDPEKLKAISIKGRATNKLIIALKKKWKEDKEFRVRQSKLNVEKGKKSWEKNKDQVLKNLEQGRETFKKKYGKNWKKKRASSLIKYIKEHPEHQREVSIRGKEIQSQKGFISKPEQVMRKLLPSDFINGQRLGNYVPDFHSPERKIVIEVDGIYWHSMDKAIKRDIEKDKYYQSLGYKIFRITDLDVNKYMKPLLEGC